MLRTMTPASVSPTRSVRSLPAVASFALSVATAPMNKVGWKGTGAAAVVAACDADTMVSNARPAAPERTSRAECATSGLVVVIDARIGPTTTD